MYERWSDAAISHRCAGEKKGKKKHKDVGGIRERACDFAPTEYLFIGAISVSVATPVVSKVTAICLALLFCEELDALW